MRNLPKEFKVRTNSPQESKTIIKTLINLGYNNPHNYKGTNYSDCYGVRDNKIQASSDIKLELSFYDFITLANQKQEQFIEIY